MPSFIPRTDKSAASQYYIMTVVHIIVGRPPLPPPLVHGVKITFLASADATEPDVIKMGPTLGKGAYGVVYSGQWQGRQVAVKVRLEDRPLAPLPGLRRIEASRQ